ncbi:E3 ubiquitin-protein ligase MSL2-like [Myzus persicae]|uniref:E3 ubiquitin-protein ligase MSL2-like n=1 Tax=Myzus persicae TaxID=13164 RepID=UPI000B9323A5|nr:E3 ubiquitin-protein ligase MSL2-like [Myzus persicae]
MSAMDMMKCYLSTNRIVLQANSTDPLTWQKLHTFLPSLHEHLSCRVCHKLLDRLNPYLGGYACTACVDQQTTENSSSTIIECYKKLCAYIHSSSFYKVMCTRVEDKLIVELITEVIGLSRSVNGYSGMVNGGVIKEEIKEEDTTLLNSSDIQLPIDNQTLEEYIDLQIFDEQEQRNQDEYVFNNIPEKKQNERGQGCRCATTTTDKLTCFGQRCPCYIEQEPCDQCKCRGCKNPRQKRSNNDDNLETDIVGRKPVILELMSSLESSPNKSKLAFSSYTMNDMLPSSSHSESYDQNGTEHKLEHANSIFNSP